MALVALSATPTTKSDPTQDLQIALTDFEATLADGLRTEYTSNIVQPDAESVTLFVAELAARNQGTHGKFLWKRLYPFLEATRQFTGIVNTFVSANPATAALVWGGVRTTILAANNVTSYFDQVTNLLWEVGRLSPTFKEFGQLYTNHVGLQHALCRYYTLVIRICTKVLTSTQRNAVSHICSTFFSPFESEFKSLLNDLTTAKSDIRDQASLAAKQASAESHKLQELESIANKRHRLSASVFRSEARQEQKQMEQYRSRQLRLHDAQLRDKVRDRLSQIDYFTAWRMSLQPRVPGTAEWFASDKSFQEWRSETRTALLYCQGAMGVGKTVFVANLTAYLLQHKKSDDVVAFHFCRSDDKSSLQTVTILGTLARQLWDNELQTLGGSALDRLLSDVRSADVDGLTTLIINRLNPNLAYLLVIDGLDECSSDELHSLRRAIFNLCEKHTGLVKLVYSARSGTSTSLFDKFPHQYKINLSKAAVRGDIDTYVDATLDHCLDDGRLKLNDPTIILEIAKVLKDGSDGMFLWVRIFISELCACLSDSAILAALEQPPKGLSELLIRIMSQVQNQTADGYALRTLEFCGIAKRPLLSRELQEALSVSPGQQCFDPREMPTDIDRVISACRGLLFLDDVNESVHYVHHSVREYLFTRANEETSYFQESKSESTLGYVCLTYLHFSDFQRQLAKCYTGSEISIQPLQIGVLSTMSSGLASKVARKLLGHQSQLKAISLRELSHKTQDLVEADSSFRLHREIETREHQFLQYAKIHWVDHVREIDVEDGSADALAVWKLFTRTVSDEDILAAKPWTDFDGTEGFPNLVFLEFEPAVLWAIQHNHPALLYLQWQVLGYLWPTNKSTIPGPPQASHNSGLLDEMQDVLWWSMHQRDHYRISDMLYSNATFHVQQNVFMKAAAAQNAHLVSQMLRNGFDVQSTAAMNALWTALEQKCVPIIELLTSARVDVDIDKNNTYSSFESACGGPHISKWILLTLLKAGTRVNVDNRSPSPIYLAAVCHSCELVNEFLDCGTEVDSLQNHGSSTETAVSSLDGQAVANSIRSGTAVDLWFDFVIPLISAIERRYYDIVTDVKRAGADPKCRAEDISLVDPVTEQCVNDRARRLAYVLITLNVGAKKTVDSGTLLIAAIMRGESMLMRTLLEAGANANTKLGSTTPLMEAVFTGSIDIVEILLQSGAKIDHIVPGRGSVLTAAIKASDGHMVEFLIARGASVSVAYDGGIRVETKDARILSRLKQARIEQSDASSSRAVILQRTDIEFTTQV